jgi:hypothetical protein
MAVQNSEHGYALIAFLVLMSVGMFILAGSLGLARSNARTTYASKVRTDTFYQSEETMNRAMSWLRMRSADMLYPFTRANFYTSFTRSSSPSVGANDGSYLSVPTRIKRAGTSDSIILTAASELGSSFFPATQNISTGSSFQTVSEFQSADLASAMVRVTLIDALPVDPTLDFGAPPNPAPQTDFYPVYRIDAMTAVNEGSRVLGYVVGSLSYIDTIGFYGKDYLEGLQNCDSYISANGAYSSATKRAHCPIGSETVIRVHQNTKIYGTARTNGSITTSSPWGGQVCADFVSNCPNPGQTCEGPSCAVPGLPTFQAWSSYCPTDQGDRTVSSNQTWTVGGNGANQKCWNTVGVNTNRTLTLTTTAYPYFIRSLSFANNSNSRLNLSPDSAGGTISLYVETIAGDAVNGNQMFNVNNRPSQFKLYYLGTADLTLNGTADMNVAIVAPYANVVVSGNFSFSGGIIAKGLRFTGSGNVHYDESLGGQSLTDVTYRLRNELQYYQ